MNTPNKILNSFSSKNTLNPKFWTNPKDPKKSKMIERVRTRLIEIANQFEDFIGLEIKVDDIQMTGSLSNFNWSDFSDVDLHLIVNFKQFPEKQKELYKELFNLKKTLFNYQHNIKIFGYDVELYIQDSSEEHTSTGIYSILENEWTVTPKKEFPKIDKKTLIKKIKTWITKIDETIEQADDEKEIKKSLDYINKLKDKIKNYRKLGLTKQGEFSYENLVFKYLRRNGYIEKLFNIKNKIIDNKLSLKENRLLYESTTIFGDTSPSWGRNGYINGPKNHGSRAFGNWQSDNAWDIFSQPGTPVYSITKGTVSNVRTSSGRNPKVYGTQVTVKGSDGYSDVFYTHLNDVNLNIGDKVDLGDPIGRIEASKTGISPHVHIGLPYGVNINKYLDESGNIINKPTSSYNEKEERSSFEKEILALFGIKSDELGGVSSDKQRKEDDPKKSDLINSVDDLMTTLEGIEDTITQQSPGGYSFQKNVEAVQIALQLLGYELPRHGVDGKFGPETANAVIKFKSDNNINESIYRSKIYKIIRELKNNINEATLMAPIESTKVTSPFGAQRRGYKHHGVDIATPTGTPLKSPSDGVVLDSAIRNDNCGGTLKIDHGGGYVTRYCHLSQINVDKGDNVKKGEVVALTGGGKNDTGRGRSTGPHLHFEMYLDGKLVDPMQHVNRTYDPSIEPAGSNTPELEGTTMENGVQITIPMIEKIISLLKSKDLKSDDLKKLTDPIITQIPQSDDDFYSSILEGIGAPVTDENLKFFYAWRQAEGGSAKNNPFNTTYKLAKDQDMTNYNSVGVKNYSSPLYGIEATIKTLKLSYYTCIVDGLKNDVGASEISKCPALEKWGTGRLVQKVVDSYDSGSAMRPKPIPTA